MLARALRAPVLRRRMTYANGDVSPSLLQTESRFFLVTLLLRFIKHDIAAFFLQKISNPSRTFTKLRNT